MAAPHGRRDRQRRSGSGDAGRAGAARPHEVRRRAAPAQIGAAQRRGAQDRRKSAFVAAAQLPPRLRRLPRQPLPGRRQAPEPAQMGRRLRRVGGLLPGHVLSALGEAAAGGAAFRETRLQKRRRLRGPLALAPVADDRRRGGKSGSGRHAQSRRRRRPVPRRVGALLAGHQPLEQSRRSPRRLHQTLPQRDTRERAALGQRLGCLPPQRLRDGAENLEAPGRPARRPERRPPALLERQSAERSEPRRRSGKMRKRTGRRSRPEHLQLYGLRRRLAQNRRRAAAEGPPPPRPRASWNAGAS